MPRLSSAWKNDCLVSFCFKLHALSCSLPQILCIELHLGDKNVSGDVTECADLFIAQKSKSGILLTLDDLGLFWTVLQNRTFSLPRLVASITLSLACYLTLCFASFSSL